MKSRTDRGCCGTALRGAVALLLGACASELQLPPQPQGEGPRIDAVVPAQGFAGDRLRITGRRLGTPVTGAQVRVGASASVPPVQLSADGSFLEVVVPDDATSGSVEVTSGGATGSGAEFRYLGLGRPRGNKVSLCAPVSLHPRQIVPIAPRRILFHTAEGLVRLVDSAHQPVFLENEVEEIVPLADGRFVSLEKPPGAVGWQRRLAVRSAEDPRVAIHSVDIEIAEGVNRMSADDAGTHALVQRYDDALLVDFVSGATRAIPVPADRRWTEVQWVGGSRFMIPGEQTADIVDWSRADPLSVDELPFEPMKISRPAGGRIATIGNDTLLHVYDTTAWPPREVGSFSLPVYPHDVVLSPRGDRLVAWSPYAVVVAGELDGAWRPIVSLPQGAVAVAATPEGFLVAGAEGDVKLVDSATGNWLASWQLHAWPNSAALSTCGDGRPVLTITRLGGPPLAVDPRSLRPTAACAPLPRDTARVFSVPGGPALWFEHRRTLRRAENGVIVEGAFDLDAALDGEELYSARTVFDGRVLSLVSSRGRTVLVDARAPPALARTTRLLEQSVNGPGPVDDGQGHLLVASDSSVWVVDAEPLLASPGFSAAIRGPVDLGERLVIGAAAARGAAVFFSVDAEFTPNMPVLAHPFDAAAAAVSAPVTLPLLFGDTIETFDLPTVMSPDGRMLFWLEDRPPAFVGVRFDAAHGRLGAPAAPVSLGSVGPLVMDPSGERLWIVEGDTDRVCLVE